MNKTRQAQNLIKKGQFVNVSVKVSLLERPWVEFELSSTSLFNVLASIKVFCRSINSHSGSGITLSVAPAYRGLYFKTFYNRNLRIFVISKSVCPWQAFLA
jgi:hypothetical protein